MTDPLTGDVLECTEYDDDNCLTPDSSGAFSCTISSSDTDNHLQIIVSSAPMKVITLIVQIVQIQILVHIQLIMNQQHYMR